MQQIRAVIFDMDGVLIDARDWHYDALNRALALFGYTISRYEHFVTYDGLPTKQKLEMLSQERGLPRGLHAFINELKQIYTTEIIHQKCRPRFRHEYALSRLRNEGLRLVLASNAVRSSVDLMMSYSCLQAFFEFSLCNEDVTNAKPDPEIYNMAIQRLGLRPAECLIVEDNINGLRAARASGSHVLAVQGPDDVTYELISNQIRNIAKAAS